MREKICAVLKSCGISGRTADFRNHFFHQFANWFQKHDPGVQAAGLELKTRRMAQTKGK